MPLRSGWKKARAWFIHLLHLDDSAHQIALGAAVGVFIAFTPTIGFQMLLVLVVTAALRANKVAGLPMPWISNPATIPPIFTLNYLLGHALVGGPSPRQFVHRLEDVIRLKGGWLASVKAWWHLMIDMALPLWVGSVIVGLVAGLVTYGVMFYLIRTYRRHLRIRTALTEAEAAAPLARRSGTRDAAAGASPLPGPSEPPPVGAASPPPGEAPTGTPSVPAASGDGPSPPPPPTDPGTRAP